MKNIYGLLIIILILIILIPLLSNNKKNINANSPYEKYIIQYNNNRCNNFKNLGPPLGPPLPSYPWPPSM